MTFCEQGSQRGLIVNRILGPGDDVRAALRVAACRGRRQDMYLSGPELFHRFQVLQTVCQDGVARVEEFLEGAMFIFLRGIFLT